MDVIKGNHVNLFPSMPAAPSPLPLPSQKLSAKSSPSPAQKALQKMGEEQMEAMAQNNRIFIKCLEETMRTGDKKEIAERAL